uniref:Uncharacterized protein n=1 Tax=Meloidogyne floridensis TaxID=298350 RepID=A0A915PE41_9BILA
MAQDLWQKLRISMSENERANDSQILEKFLQETDYIKVMYDLKRHLRKLRNSRHELENNIPEIKPQFDNSHLLPELPPLHPSQNENTQASLKLVYTNYSDNSYRNRTFSNFCLYPNPSSTEQSDEQLVNNPTPSIKRFTTEMNKLDPLTIPSGFPPLEEINNGKNPNDYISKNSEGIMLNTKIVNERVKSNNVCVPQILNRPSNESIDKRPISPPPGFPPFEEICIIKNTPNDLKEFICEEITPLPEIINEVNEVKPDNYSEEISLVLPNDPVSALSPNPPLSLLNNSQMSTSSQIIYSSETTYINSSEEILKEKKIINNNGKCVKKWGVKLKKPRKKQRNLPKPRELIVKNHFRHLVPILQRSFKEFKIAPQNEIKDNRIPSKYRYAYLNEIDPSPELQKKGGDKQNSKTDLEISEENKEKFKGKYEELKLLISEINKKELNELNKNDIKNMLEIYLSFEEFKGSIGNKPSTSDSSTSVKENILLNDDSINNQVALLQIKEITNLLINTENKDNLRKSDSNVFAKEFYKLQKENIKMFKFVKKNMRKYLGDFNLFNHLEMLFPVQMRIEEKIYRQIFFTSTIKEENKENINFAEIGIKYSKLMKIAVRIMMRKTERDSDEDEEYLIRKNNEDKIEHAETKNCLSKFFTTFEKFIINMPISNDLIQTFAEFLYLKYCDGNGMLKTYNINRQEEDEKLKDLLSYLKEKIGKDLTEIYNNNEQFQKDYLNEREKSEDEILSLLKQNYLELSNEHSTPLTEEKALISVDILVSIYSINQQMLTHFPEQIYRDWEYYSTLMLIFVDKIFEENKEISKEMTKEFTKIMNMLYLLRVLSDEEILLQGE